MATLVCFHAHPDDEAIATGGVMAQAADAGHRVVLVVATRGELGEVAPDFLAPGEQLWERRVDEVSAAAGILGIARCEFLGYTDSGMMGESTNDDPACFWRADVEDAATKLAAILADERPEALTIYDAFGGYGHPDHIQVHRVGARAAELAGVPRVYEATMDRDAMRAMLEEQLRTPGDGQLREMAVGMLADGGPHMGVPGADITTRVDVTPWVRRKHDALAAHASQVPPESWFMSASDEIFARMFGTECFVRRGAAPGTAETSLWP